MSKNTPQEQKVLSAENYIKSVSKQRGDNLVISKQEAARHLELFAKQKMFEMVDMVVNQTLYELKNEAWDQKWYSWGYSELTELIHLSQNDIIETIKSRIDGKE